MLLSGTWNQGGVIFTAHKILQKCQWWPKEVFQKVSQPSSTPVWTGHKWPRHCTHCNISLCHCWGHCPSPAPTSPNPTAHHSHQWVCLSRVLLWFWTELTLLDDDDDDDDGIFSYWKTHIKTRSQTRNTRHQIPSPNLSWDLAVTGEDQPPEATKSNSILLQQLCLGLSGKVNNWFFHGRGRKRWQWSSRDKHRTGYECVFTTGPDRLLTF